MKATIYISGEIGIKTKLTDVIRQFKSYKDATEVEVLIDSIGGDVDEGKSIYNYLRNLNIPVTTIAKKAYSIAASIYMAGDVRIAPSEEKVIMVHLPLASNIVGGADYLEFVTKELRKIEKEFVTFYSSFTEIDNETILQLLRNETFMTGQEAVEMGFATQLQDTKQYKAVAKLELKKEKDLKMTKKEKGLFKAIKNFLSVDLKALVVQDSTGKEIDFIELLEGDEIKKGDKAEIEGEPAEGEFLSKDGKEIMVFEKGELIEIKEAEEEKEEEEKEKESDEANEDESLDELIAKLETSIFEKFEAKLNAKLDEQNDKITKLKKLIGSEDVKIEAKSTEIKTKNKNYLR